MTTIYLIRHAEAEGNLYRRIHGQYDSLITERGKLQIKELEKRFKAIQIDHVYSSDLSRARATAGAILKNRELELMTLTQLREVSMGVWEDLTWGEVERFEPKQLDYFNNDPSLWKVEGCEDFQSLQQRMTNALLEIADKHDGEAVAIVSHGSIIRTFICGVLDVPPHEINRVKHCDNTAVTRLFVENKTISLNYYGDNKHLSDELSTFAHQKWWRENTTYDSTNLRFVPFDLENDSERYIEFRRDAWETQYGLNNAEQNIWLKEAENNARAHSRAVSLALIADTPVGLIELNTKECAEDKVGVIEFFYMVNEQRRTGIAVQLLGQAVSVYRSLGREKLRMAVSDKNAQALGFCQKYGFITTGEKLNTSGRYFIMELDIAVR